MPARLSFDEGGNYVGMSLVDRNAVLSDPVYRAVGQSLIRTFSKCKHVKAPERLKGRQVEVVVSIRLDDFSNNPAGTAANPNDQQKSGNGALSMPRNNDTARPISNADAAALRRLFYCHTYIGSFYTVAGNSFRPISDDAQKAAVTSFGKLNELVQKLNATGFSNIVKNYYDDSTIGQSVKDAGGIEGRMGIYIVVKRWSDISKCVNDMNAGNNVLSSTTGGKVQFTEMDFSYAYGFYRSGVNVNYNIDDVTYCVSSIMIEIANVIKASKLSAQEIAFNIEPAKQLFIDGFEKVKRTLLARGYTESQFSEYTSRFHADKMQYKGGLQELGRCVPIVSRFIASQ